MNDFSYTVTSFGHSITLESIKSEHLRLADDEEIISIWKNLCGRDSKRCMSIYWKVVITIRGFRHTSRDMERF